MSKRILPYLTHLLTLAGLLLILVGGSIWWRQSRLEAALLNQEERILFSSIATESVPPSLPTFPEAAGGEQVDSAVASPSPVRSATPVPGEPAQPVAPTATALVSPTPLPFPPAHSLPTRIVAPSIGLAVEVVEMGWEVKQDGQGNSYSEWVVPGWAAGWHKNAALPGHGGNVVLSGHHNVEGEVFRDLANLEPGDEIVLEADGVTYRYQVQEKYIVKEKGEPPEVQRKNNEFITQSGDERLTLVTCWPYETNTHRVIVIARPLLLDGSPPPGAR